MTRSLARKLAGVFVLLVPMTLAGCIISIEDDDATFTVDNESSQLIRQVHLADFGARQWGPNELPKSLAPGDHLVIRGIDCGYYDALLVAGSGVTCVQEALRLCDGRYTWTVDDNTLASCQR